MIVADLLEELRVGILRDSSSLTSGSDDQLWSDARLVAYIHQGQVRFAKRTLSLRDNTTPAVTQVTLVAGQSEYPTHMAVLSTLSARYDTDTVNMPRASAERLDRSGSTESLYFDVNTASTLAPGRPITWATDQAARTFRVYPTPSAAEAGKIIRLRVARLPINTLSTLDLYASPEIPEEYHYDILEYAAYKALSNHDADAGSNAVDATQLTPAEKHKANFETAIKEALQESKREMFAPAFWDFTAMPGVAYSR